MLSDKEKDKITQALLLKVGNSYECPICHNHSFTILDGYFVQKIQDKFTGIDLSSGSMLPSIALVCNKCGFTSYHNLGVLGLMNNSDKSTE